MANPTKLRVVPWFATNAFTGAAKDSVSLTDQAAFMHRLNGGVVVPWFDEIRVHKTDDYTLKDSVDESRKLTFKTDAAGSVSGSIFYSSWNMIPDMRSGNGIKWGVEKNNYHSTENVSWNNAFYVHSPGSGLDHRQSYYFGNSRKYVDDKGWESEKTYHSYMKNVLGLYWTWRRVDKEYYSVIGKIALEYTDDQGTIYTMIPPHPTFDDGETGYSNTWYAPGGNGDIKNKDAVTVNRGVGLLPHQAQFVVDQGLYFKGMHIQVNRETPASPGSSDPKGWFFNFTPWILGDTKTRFDDGFGLNIWDLYMLEGRTSNDPIVKTFSDEYIKAFWNDRGTQQREAYFKEAKNIDTGKQLVNVRNSNDDSLKYTDELLEIKPVPVTKQPGSSSGSTTYVYSNIKNEPWDNLAEGVEP